jgi:hypothetical protein
MICPADPSGVMACQVSGRRLELNQRGRNGFGLPVPDPFPPAPLMSYVPTSREYSMPAVHPETGPGQPDFVPVRYVRTKRRSEEGLPVFSFDRYQYEPAAASA